MLFAKIAYKSGNAPFETDDVLLSFPEPRTPTRLSRSSLEKGAHHVGLVGKICKNDTMSKTITMPTSDPNQITRFLFMVLCFSVLFTVTQIFFCSWVICFHLCFYGIHRQQPGRQQVNPGLQVPVPCALFVGGKVGHHVQHRR